MSQQAQGLLSAFAQTDELPLALRQDFAAAEELVGETEVVAAVDRLAIELTVDMQDQNPVVIAIMHGGLYLMGMLLQRLVFPLQQGYVHVTRYGQETTGGELVWSASHHPPLVGRNVLLVDDILDHGVTLEALHTWAQQEGAASVKTAVLVRKDIQKQSIAADYCAIECADRFLFGCGMDYAEYGRNLPAIFAILQAGEQEEPQR
jgi:hypoxanthine phosphoribosyltransferase